MGPGGGAVDHHERRRLADFDKSGENLLPQLAFGPAIVPASGSARPRQPSRKRRMMSADDTPVVFALRAGVELRKMRLDHRPFPIVQPEIVRHDSGPDELESRLSNQFNWVQNLD
jgi:hypothetical protein